MPIERCRSGGGLAQNLRDPPTRAKRLRPPALPREHGGYLTLSAGAITAGLVSPAPGPALGVMLAVSAAFFARDPLERKGGPGPLDRVALVFEAALAAFGAWAAARTTPVWGAVTIAAALATLGASRLAQRTRRQRSAPFELVGMAALGGAAGLAALAGGTPLACAAPLGLLLAVNAALSVPLVRTELRPRERPLGRAAELAALGATLTAGAGAWLLSGPTAALAVAPRLLHVALRALGLRPRLRPNVVGLREAAILALTSALLVLALR